jgi:hypothetical protein
MEGSTLTDNAQSDATNSAVSSHAQPSDSIDAWDPVADSRHPSFDLSSALVRPATAFSDVSLLPTTSSSHEDGLPAVHDATDVHSSCTHHQYEATWDP